MSGFGREVRLSVDPELETGDFFVQFARISAAIGTPNRLKLIDRLCQGEQSVEQLAAASDLSVANASRHLRVLAEARLVASRRSPPYVYYRLADAAVCRLWLSLQELGYQRLAEVRQAVAAYETADPGMTAMTRDEFLDRITVDEVVLLDVRPAPEYGAGHLPGAISIPLKELASRLAELPTNREIVAYCRGPYCVLSVEAVRLLRDAGRRACRLEDGVLQWQAAGLPVEAAT